MTMHALVVGTFVPMLASVDEWLSKCEDRPDVGEATLAPGMYALGYQIHVACDHALASAAHLADLAAPVGETRPNVSVAALRARIADTIARLRAMPAGRFRGAARRRIQLPLDDGLRMTMGGERFARDWALPLFSFHVVLAYGMLRHAGVELGVRDYMRHVGDAITPG